jgi:hypothetical protein
MLKFALFTGFNTIQRRHWHHTELIKVSHCKKRNREPDQGEEPNETSVDEDCDIRHDVRQPDWDGRYADEQYSIEDTKTQVLVPKATYVRGRFSHIQMIILQEFRLHDDSLCGCLGHTQYHYTVIVVTVRFSVVARSLRAPSPDRVNIGPGKVSLIDRSALLISVSRIA